jgi:hypothetical protein
MGLGSFHGGHDGRTASWRATSARSPRPTCATSANSRPALEELAGLPVRFVLGPPRRARFHEHGAGRRQPGGRADEPFLAAARASGVPITSETALFLELCPARIAAVTGTQGKSSTCNTLAQLLVASGIPCHLGGNIGRSLLDAALAMTADEIVVLEMSSYQLEALPQRLRGRDGPPRVEVACVVNVLAITSNGTAPSRRTRRRNGASSNCRRRVAGRAVGFVGRGCAPPRVECSGPHARGRVSDRAHGPRLEPARRGVPLPPRGLGRVADLALPG